ncbi:MAG: hypothetical protein ISR65_07010 [Bacteriovoracaceae bacterium]|nr:hypothetical protein [Bacteriovoracaceae bacterium]
MAKTKETLISENVDATCFKPVKHVVLLRNDTSGTTILDEHAVCLVELGSKHIVITVPEHSCQASHTLTLFLLKYPLKTKIKALPVFGRHIKSALEVMGKVVNIIKVKDSKLWSLEIEFTQYDQLQWSKLIKVYQKRQNSINKTIRIGKGNYV